MKSVSILILHFAILFEMDTGYAICRDTLRTVGLCYICQDALIIINLVTNSVTKKYINFQDNIVNNSSCVYQ